MAAAAGLPVPAHGRPRGGRQECLPGKSTRTRFQGWRRLQLPPLARLLKAHSPDLHLIKLGETVEHASDGADDHEVAGSIYRLLQFLG
jgi:hypothetical protein